MGCPECESLMVCWLVLPSLTRLIVGANPAPSKVSKNFFFFISIFSYISYYECILKKIQGITLDNVEKSSSYVFLDNSAAYVLKLPNLNPQCGLVFNARYKCYKFRICCKFLNYNT